LFLYKNYIEEVEELTLPFLKELYLNNNKIKRFTVGLCINLKELFLHNNCLEKLDTFKNCRNLRTLDLSFNQISSFASIVDSIKTNRNINKLSIQENPFFKFVSEDVNIYRKILCRILPLKYLNYQEINNKTLFKFNRKDVEKNETVKDNAENLNNLNEIYRGLFRRTINRVKEEFDEKNIETKKGKDYSYLENNFLTSINNNVQLSIIKNFLLIIDNIEIIPNDFSVISFNKVYLTLSQMFLKMKNYRLSKIVRIQKNFRLTRVKKSNKKIILIQKTFRRFRVMNKIKKIKNIRFDDDDELFNVEEMEKHFNQNFDEDNLAQNINVENFDLNKFIQEVNVTSHKPIVKHHHKTNVRKEEIPYPKKNLKEEEKERSKYEVKVSDNHNDNPMSKNKEIKTLGSNNANGVSLRNGLEGNKKNNYNLKDIDKVISDIKQRNEANNSGKKERDIELVKFPAIDEKNRNQVSKISDEESKMSVKSSSQNNDIKLPLLSNNYNYNIINNNSKISDISMLSENSKISSYTKDSRNTKLSQKSKIINPVSILSSKQIDQINLK
jgi:hypothetical protein